MNAPATRQPSSPRTITTVSTAARFSKWLSNSSSTYSPGGAPGSDVEN